MYKKLSNQGKKAIIQFCNLKMLRKRINGVSKGTLGSYLNRGMPNKILKVYKKKKK
jgi:hypothetical protein